MYLKCESAAIFGPELHDRVCFEQNLRLLPGSYILPISAHVRSSVLRGPLRFVDAVIRRSSFPNTRNMAYSLTH